jgi:class 3 adenylate cyclase
MQDDNPPVDSRPSLERRLATILVADVFGYSRMMQVNEERTVEIFRGHREIFDELIRQHHGRIFNTAGDAVLAEFPSTVESVRCATEIQTALRTRNEHLPEEQRMWFRIGINLGDVIVQGGDLLGDGVNVAARIQTVAEPGGISISGSVYDQIQNKLTLQFISMGERSFKNIVQPIRTFSIVEANGAAMPVTSTPERPKGRKLTGIIVAVIALIAVAGGGYWIFQKYEPRRAQELQQAVDLERQSAEAKRKAAEAKAKANEEQLTAKAQQLQAKLEAEAYQRQAAEAQLRKAKIEAETQEAKAALDRVENEKKRLD